MSGCAGEANFTVAYLAGTTKITTAVVNGTYRTGNLAPNAFKALKVVIGAKSGTHAPAQKTCSITISSAGDPSQMDVVTAVATAT